MENVVATIKLENDHQVILHSTIEMPSPPYQESCNNSLIKREQNHENFCNNSYGSYNNCSNNEYIYNQGNMLKENDYYYDRYAENYRQYGLYNGQDQYLQMFNNYSGYCQQTLPMNLVYQNHREINIVESTNNYDGNDELFEYKDVSQLVSVVETDQGGYCESSGNQENEQITVKREPFDNAEKNNQEVSSSKKFLSRLGTQPLENHTNRNQSVQEDNNTIADNDLNLIPPTIINFRDHMTSVHVDEYNVSHHFLCTNKQVSESPEDLNNKKHVCDICFKRFKCKTYLMAHKAIHTGEKPFTCEMCSKTFARKFLLMLHIRYHMGVKPYKCDVCGNAFAEKNTLTRHMRTHTGEKPYRCEECGKCFAGRKDLLTHSKTHSDEKDHKCEICLKDFKTRAYLLVHLKIHVEQKPFNCHLCDKGYNTKEKLTHHIRSHTGERPFQCSNHMKTHRYTTAAVDDSSVQEQQQFPTNEYIKQEEYVEDDVKREVVDDDVVVGDCSIVPPINHRLVIENVAMDANEIKTELNTKHIKLELFDDN
ncbi:Zinc finger, C2H2 type [Popillia japonica]|uniref:Zinc finger, C2H2 type n=1 Tax=Popillia japonica TaxID=7064 RepID=A0AAW1KLT5_POPJA